MLWVEAAWAEGMPRYKRPNIEQKTLLSDNQDVRPLSSLFKYTNVALITNACARSSQPTLIENRGIARSNANTSTTKVLTSNGLTKRMLHATEDAFANAQALLD
jgi:hypothetical protein